MEQQNTTPKEQRPNSQKKHHKRNFFKKDNQKKEPVPTWDVENRGIELPETKADLMVILSETDPEELLMASLVEQNKKLKTIALKKTELELDNIDNIDNIEGIEGVEGVDVTEAIEAPTPKIKINLAKECPICQKPIREIMYALHDYDHDQLAHFDCVYKKVAASVKEKLIDKRYLAYLGSGSFGIMEQGQNKQPMTLIEKIYPGAPLEEMLHGDENLKDDEI